MCLFFPGQVCLHGALFVTKYFCLFKPHSSTLIFFPSLSFTPDSSLSLLLLPWVVKGGLRNAGCSQFIMLHFCHFFLTLFSWSSVDSLLCLLTMGCSSSWDISICCGVSSSMTCSNICSVVALYELQRSICFTMVFFRGCRGISGDLLL